MTPDPDVDHIVPLSEGGSDEDVNLQLLCSGPDECHDRKSKAERAKLNNIR